MWIDPMLLTDRETPFESEKHIAELKLDGIRNIVSHEDSIQIYTRHRNEITSRFKEVVDAAAEATKKGTILDGELVVSDLETGKPDFEETMRRFSSNPKHIRTPGLTFVAFDILQYQGKSTRSLPLMERKAILETAVQENEIIKRIRYMEHRFTDFFELCKQQQLEGIVIKSRNGRYESGRRPEGNWQRVVVFKREQCVITGFSKKEAVWLIGVYRDGRIIPAGALKYGLTPKHRKKVYPILKNSVIRETKDYAYVDPLIHITVRFRHWTKSGKMRLPVLEEVLTANQELLL